MIRVEEIRAKVAKFLKEEFPEIADDMKVTGTDEEIVDVLYGMMTGEEPE